MPVNCTRGTVASVNLDPSVGREIMKERLCLVVQSDLLNKHSQLTIIAPITAREPHGKRIGPTWVPIAKGEAGLVKDSLVVCHQIRVIDESRIGKIWGQVKPATLARV